MEVAGEKGRVFVTGAGGYVGSWLVKLLLSNGYKVHGTVRDLSDEKNAHLRKFEKASENLQLFKADVLHYDTLKAAFAGCEGVFHVASPVPATKVLDPELELITPAVNGTLNVLQACSEMKIKRVIVVSSITAVSLNPHWPHDKLMDEKCWSSKEFCKKIENWYCLSKTMAEHAAWEYAEKNGLDLVTVCPSVVVGPLLQPTASTSSMFLIYVTKGGPEPMLDYLWHFVDVRDVADALLLVYEKPESSGRYICAASPITIRELVDLLKGMYPNYGYQKNIVEVPPNAPLTSEKLKKLGWKCRPLEETLTDAVESYGEAGLLDELEGHTHHFPPVYKFT
ncbi:cinnamoyl-CoA reductase 1-like isoform X3 [Phoenix dactylifera]|uniref:Cinnamoyl-CoA reductase 1-like isoform X3 n=1 Tax=Phoenix dactylifera TaxID=42345 RepID=A0A8B9ATN9_PHODC|nr:cinnamoyl-CoA reductase 1-like isoform X3 [Phoenix dactylifera]